MVDKNILEEDTLKQLPVEMQELSQAQLEREKYRISTEPEMEKVGIEAEIEKARNEQKSRFREIEEKRFGSEDIRNNFDLAN